MEITEKMIEAAYTGLAEHRDLYVDRKDVMAILASVLSAAPVAVKVRELEWKEIYADRGDGQSDFTGEWGASCILGVYAINISICGDMHAPWELFDADNGKIGNFDTMDAAKAAAQADYERRVMSSLEPAPVKAEPVAWQYRWKIDGEWVNWRVADASQKHPSLSTLEERPLFTSPPDLAAENARLREALEWIAYHYDNQDMNHVDFRVEAATRARAALKGCA